MPIHGFGARQRHTCDTHSAATERGPRPPFGR